jgi:choline dehydrogenase-like flavoprotein
VAANSYDVIVIGTGAGGGIAIKALCEAGLKVCALNAGRRLDPQRDFRYHRMPWDLKYRGFGNPRTRAQSYGYMDNEYTHDAWEHSIKFTAAPGQRVDVAAMLRCGRQNELLGPLVGPLRRP